MRIHIDRNTVTFNSDYILFKSEIRLINLEDIKMLITDHVRFYNFHDNKWYIIK